jgi:hypothetical protein
MLEVGCGQEAPMWTTSLVDALGWLNQSIEEAHESLAQFSDAFAYGQSCALPKIFPKNEIREIACLDRLRMLYYEGSRLKGGGGP